MIQILIGFLLGGLIGFGAYRAGALTQSGAWAAILTGGLIFGFGGLPWAVLLLVFFITSSVLSRAFTRRKESLSEKFSKGSRRDYGQVLANGGVGALLAITLVLLPDMEWQWVAYAGAMAAVNADTWATELGVLSRASPRLITSGKIVERGTSGGITLTGYLAAAGGAALVGLAAVLFTPGAPWLMFIGTITLSGVAGSTLDSLLGATAQAIYYCPQCQKETERHPKHICGTETTQVRGWRWLNNDVVNLLCSLMGAFAAVGLVYLLNLLSI
jgi:uncharacterized protein (TIGR00297 family)